jgi:2-polyprenyl-3-methyl-5-hydroxy-6-metoxy-1,4-benzoquinol methylase
MEASTSSAADAPGSPGAGVVWEETPCLLCGGGRWRPVDGAASLVVEGTRSGVVRCLDCGLAFTNPRPSPGTIHRFYSDYEPHQTCGLTPSRRRHVGSPWQKLKFWEPYSAQRHGLPWHGRGRLLDFGCGAGAFMEMMHLRGWQVLGLDVCPAIIARIRSELSLPALAGSLPHEGLSPESFDVVTMWHALEHVHQPREVLEQVRRLLVPGGKLVLGVPNMHSAMCRWFGPAWYGWSMPHHLTHFTPATLLRMVERAGFHVEKLRMVRNPAWIPGSLETARRQQRPLGWRRWLGKRFIARQVATWLYWTRQADEIALTAVRPGAAPHGTCAENKTPHSNARRRNAVHGA